MLPLHEVVADLVNQRKGFAKDILERHGDLLEHGEPVHDGEVSARRDSVQIVAVMRRLGREVAEIERLDGGIFLLGLPEIVRRQPVPEAAAARVQLHVERVAADIALQLDEVVATAQRAELGNAALGASLAAPRRLPGVIDG